MVIDTRRAQLVLRGVLWWLCFGKDFIDYLRKKHPRIRVADLAFEPEGGCARSTAAWPGRGLYLSDLVGAEGLVF